MKFSDEELLKRVPEHDLRAVARLITLSENRSPRARNIQAQLFKKTGKAHVIGVTGSPGAGKSTLVDEMARQWKAKGKKVAILAIDPTSPFSGGAILGDRIRMVKAAEHSDVFIRSMATRGSLGGLSRATVDAVQILDSAGFDIILVETVGVGQAEVDIVRTADTCLVVLVPGMGDSVQAIKAGILEIADVFVINKADRDGADLLHKDLRILLSLSDPDEQKWTIPIVKTIATTGTGTEELITKVDEHRQWLVSSPEGKSRRRKILENTILKVSIELMTEKMIEGSKDILDGLIDECAARTMDPYTAVERLMARASK